MAGKTKSLEATVSIDIKFVLNCFSLSTSASFLVVKTVIVNVSCNDKLYVRTGMLLS